MPHFFPPEMPKGKRLFDLLVAFLALIIFSPVLLIIALLVRIYHGAPILFKQQRPGYKEVPFFIYKFRTMTNRVDAQGNLLPDAKRLTRLGKFLRATSLDEVPEFLNVLRGDLSLVGPRPLLMEYLPLYNAEQMRRHEVLPGIGVLGNEQDDAPKLLYVNLFPGERVLLRQAYGLASSVFEEFGCVHRPSFHLI